MLRSSQFLKLLRLNLEQHVAGGLAVPIETTVVICDLMRHLERDCQRMETRLAGEVVPLGLMRSNDDKIASLAAFAEKRSAAKPSKTTEPD